MLKLVNYALFGAEFDPNHGQHSAIRQLMDKHNLHGLEVIQYDDWHACDVSTLPSNITGLHMRFWPIWLDFWREDREELLKQFGEEEAYTQYYGGASKMALVEYYRKELQVAETLGVKYVVFHVCHVQLEHCYNYQFSYSDGEVAEAFIELLNQALAGLNLNFEILFENVWWPGFNMLDQTIAAKLMNEVQYAHKGFMLDVGHLMNTNLELKSEEEAVVHMLTVLDQLGDLSQHIRGIHLHSSLSGDYVKQAMAKVWEHDLNQDFFQRYVGSFEHIGQIDGHVPFKHNAIQKLIGRVQPQYLVCEFAAASLEVLDRYLEEQSAALAISGIPLI